MFVLLVSGGGCSPSGQANVTKDEEAAFRDRDPKHIHGPPAGFGPGGPAGAKGGPPAAALNPPKEPNGK
jgi:hypothetical protein